VSDDATLPVSVVIPTIGRIQLLERCVRSVMSCVPAPAEVVIVDQSGGRDIIDLGARLGARVVVCPTRGIAVGTNLGIAEARYREVLVTHDDCTVAADWIAVAHELRITHPHAILTGRVLPPDGSRYVPSTISSTEPCDYTGTIRSGVLYPANMSLDRDAVLRFGGFDERAGLRVAAEDNDFCYRWLRAGRQLRYEPALVVWHHDWRSPAELVRTHVGYARAQGAFYAKHVRAGDPHVLPLLWWDVSHGCIAAVGGRVKRRPRWTEPYREMVGPLLAGFFTNLLRTDGEAGRSQRGGG
jgi:GT2 family glycosyltransferase